MIGNTAKRRRVGIVDYHAGNIHSLESAFEQTGADVTRVTPEQGAEHCTHLVLPGVGAFGFCASRLRASALEVELREWALEQQRPLLGICVGMQLLAERSEESPGVDGLAWLGGEIRQLESSPEVRVPHVGWNAVEFAADCGGYGKGESADFYFDHSYAFCDAGQSDVVGLCHHGQSFAAVLLRDNIMAVQFHPEKSQDAGLRFLNGFLEL